MAAAYRTRLLWPCPQEFTQPTLTALVSVPMNASTRKAATVFLSPWTDPITKVRFRVNGRLGTPPTYRISLQGVNTSGQPDGTVKGGGSPASATFTPPADATWDGTVRTITLANGYTPTISEPLAMVIEYSSGTINASNYMDLTLWAAGQGTITGTPYGIYASAGTWAAREGAHLPVWGIGSATDNFGFPFKASNHGLAFVDGYRRAAKFTLPSRWGSTFQIAGLRMLLTTPASGSWKGAIWNAAGTELQSVTIPYYASALPGFTSSELDNPRSHEIYFAPSSLATLNFGTTYYAGVERVSGGGNVSLHLYQFEDVPGLESLPGGSLTTFSRWNGSLWEDVSPFRPLLELILKDMTAANRVLVSPGSGRFGVQEF